MKNSFVMRVDNDLNINTTNSVYTSIFAQYERVVIESLITSFGLDFLINDQYGGDVDTINNVRKIDTDSNLNYKNERNRSDYETVQQNKYSRETHNDYHKNGKNFQRVKHEARQEFNNNGFKPIEDEYTGGRIGFYGHSKHVAPNKKAELDHIISTKEINNDRGRVLSGLDGKTLADAETNFAWTNKSLNASMGEKTNSEYLSRHPELNEETQKNILEKDQSARKAYNNSVNYGYYGGSKFLFDTSKAATKVGLKMGLRQALGLVFTEIWFAVKFEIENCTETGAVLFRKIAKGVQSGYANAKEKFKEIWAKFIEGAIAGVLSSLVTTICNIFFTTAKSFIKILRQSWASLVEALKILLFNPDCLPFGERFRAATKVIATGASIIAGSLITEVVSKTPLGAIPVLGEVVQTFCGTLITGIFSCSLLYLLDTNETINKIVRFLNKIPTVENIIAYYKQQAILLDEYSAKLMDIDLETFKREVGAFSRAVSILSRTDDFSELNIELKAVYADLGIDLPWHGYTSFDCFMNDSDSVLTFN